MMMGGGGGQYIGHINYAEIKTRPKIRAATLRRMLSHLIPHWHYFVLILLCICTVAALGLVPPLLIRTLIDDAIPRGDAWLLNVLAVGMIVVPAIAGLVGVAQNYLNTLVGQRVMYDLRNQMYRQLQRMSLGFFTNTKSGEITSRLVNDVAGVQNVLTGTLVAVMTNSVTVASTLILIFSLNWQLSVLSIAILPLFIAPTRRVGRIRQRIAGETQSRQADLTSFIHETLNVSGFLLMKAFVREKLEARRFSARTQDLMSLQVRQALVGRWFFMALTLFGAVGPALIFWYGGHLVLSGQLTVGTIVAFVAFLARLYGPISALANVHVDVMTSVALFDRIFQYLDMPPGIAEKSDAKRVEQIAGHIRFTGVSFSYDGGDRKALEDISFEVLPGQLAAFVGPSGSGKTTATYLVPRFYDPVEGTVEVDGHDLRDLTLEDLRNHIGMVTQETYLFHTTIRENLLYGKPDATEEEMVRACQAAYIHDFIADLPDGYDTVVGERGYRLSGGEKQRLAIARVLLKNPGVLILDEATASLDSRSERLIQAALAPLLRGRTSLVIAHRLSTILAADVILVLDRGRLVEQGTHAELLAHGGLYARLYEEQFKRDTDGAAPDGEFGATSARHTTSERSAGAPDAC
ncbi:MAG: ABC transporter ATP-binding protein [Chloroflexi bacterium]|nr:ABC transporter ATP-binding protein [Chloroflexota bacterium]